MKNPPFNTLKELQKSGQNINFEIFFVIYDIEKIEQIL